jgi:hypothetical protein
MLLNMLLNLLLNLLLNTFSTLQLMLSVHKNKDNDPELIFSDEISGYSDYDITEYFTLCA